MSNPSRSDVIQSFLTAPKSLSKYQSLSQYDHEGDPLSVVYGEHSIVLKMQSTVSKEYFAVKIYFLIGDNPHEVYDSLSKYINISDNPYFVPFHFCQNEINVLSNQYPVLYMELIDGFPLGKYLNTLVERGDIFEIFKFACQFDKMAQWLLDQPFCHGDLSSDNIIIDYHGNIRLVDYDNIYTPDLDGRNAYPLDSQNFCHPRRNLNHFGPYIDDFTVLLISLTLHALVLDPKRGSDIDFSKQMLFDVNTMNNFVSEYSKIANSLCNNLRTSGRIALLQTALGNDADIRLSGLKEIISFVPNPNFNINYEDLPVNCEDVPIDFNFLDRYEKSLPPSEGLIAVFAGDFWGYVNLKGKEIIPCIYQHASQFSDGLAEVGFCFRYGLIDHFGQLVTPIKYDIIGQFIDGIAHVTIYKGNGYNCDGLIDKNGIELTEIKYSEIFDFVEGLARVELSGSYGFINKEGKEIIPLRYSNASDFSDGLAIVSENVLYGCIDYSGKIVIEMSFVEIMPFHDGMAKVLYGYNEYTRDNFYIDKNGNAIARGQHYEKFPFSEGLAHVEDFGHHGFINKVGNIVIPLKYDYAESFKSGFAVFSLNGRYGYLDKSGREFIPPKYDKAYSFIEDKAIVELYGKHFYLYKDGTEFLIHDDNPHIEDF